MAQHLAWQSSGHGGFEALTSQPVHNPPFSYQSKAFSTIFTTGCTQAIQTSQRGHGVGSALVSHLGSDRRKECRTVSKALLRWASLPSWRPAHSKLKKNTSWLSQSQSRSNQCRPASTAANTDTRFCVKRPGQAIRPASTNPQSPLALTGGTS